MRGQQAKVRTGRAGERPDKRTLEDGYRLAFQDFVIWRSAWLLDIRAIGLPVLIIIRAYRSPAAATGPSRPLRRCRLREAV